LTPKLIIDRRSPHPLYRQVHEALCRAILTRDLAPGAALPSTRALARRLGVSRNTVLAAYEELAAEGLIKGRIGSGTRVRGGARRKTRADLRFFLRESQYPIEPASFCDPDGNVLYLHSGS